MSGGNTFYTAVANNDSARELMERDKLRELAVVLTQKVRENASIDWTMTPIAIGTGSWSPHDRTAGVA